MVGKIIQKSKKIKIYGLIPSVEFQKAKSCAEVIFNI
jgi:hypothetical protein